MASLFILPQKSIRNDSRDGLREARAQNAFGPSSIMANLAHHCPNLSELRLCQIGKMSDEFLVHVAKLKKTLTSLDLSSDPATSSLGTEAIIALLNEIGSNLVHLNLSKNDLLTDELFSEGLAPNARVLTSLVLEELPEITDAAVGAFFSNTTNKPMHRISLRRNHELADDALIGLLKHSGATLAELDINSMRTTSNDALLAIGMQAPGLKTLDIGFCRQVDDFVVKSVLDGCEGIKDIAVFGCNKLTDNCPRKVGSITSTQDVYLLSSWIPNSAALTSVVLRHIPYEP